ncbi:MAG: ATP-binding protein [Dehalococcoidia bacterium]
MITLLAEEPLAERYERRSVISTSNLVFSEWTRIVQDSNTPECLC